MKKNVGLEPFTESFHCKSRMHCVACRNLEGGRKFRQQMMRHFSVSDDNVDFVCPYQVPWEFQPKPGSISIIQERPSPTMAQVKTFMEAIATGKYVESEVVKERLNICRTCDFRRLTRDGVEWCGACGCKVAAKERELNNLAAYVERLPNYGCKHPLRTKGLGWKR